MNRARGLSLLELLVVVALVAGIVLAGRAQDWFEKVYEIRLILPAEGSLGLQKGAEVQILGTAVGRVDRIRVLEDGRKVRFFKSTGELVDV